MQRKANSQSTRKPIISTPQGACYWLFFADRHVSKRIYPEIIRKEGRDADATENESRKASDVKGKVAVCNFGTGDYDGTWDGVFLECFPSAGGGVV